MKHQFLSFILIFCGLLCCTQSKTTSVWQDCYQKMCTTFDHDYTFNAQFSALFLKPSSSNLHFGAEAVPLPLPSPYWNIFDICPQYHFGFDLGLTLQCNQSNNSFSIDWEHFRSCDTRAVSVNSENMIGPFFEIGPDATPYKNASSTVVFHFNQVNLDFAHTFDCNNCFTTTLYAGVGLARLKQTLSFTYSNEKGDITRNILTPTCFKGAGPQFGADFYYTFLNNFYISGNGLCTIFVGPTKTHTQFSSIAPELQAVGITPPNEQSINSQKRTLVVPAFEEKIGLGYNFDWQECYSLKLEVGYQAQIYLNALQTIDIGSEVITPPILPDTIGVFARTFQRNISNFSLAGPYLSIDIRF